MFDKLTAISVFASLYSSGLYNLKLHPLTVNIYIDSFEFLLLIRHTENKTIFELETLIRYHCSVNNYSPLNNIIELKEHFLLGWRFPNESEFLEEHLRMNIA